MMQRRRCVGFRAPFDEQRQQFNDAGYYLYHDGKEERGMQQILLKNI